MKPPLKPLALVLLLSAPLTLGACQTRTAIVATEGCQVFRPITYSQQDTRPTVRQIVSHNAAWGAACPGSRQ